MAACAVGNGHAIHAMVLDCVKEIGNELFFIFKNTYKDNKQVEIQVGMEFNNIILILNKLFILKKEMFEFKKDAGNAPLEFYYVHIDFDGKP